MGFSTCGIPIDDTAAIYCEDGGAPIDSAPLNRAARDGETRRRLAAGESVRAVARALRCGLATVQRARLAVAMRGAPRPVSGYGPESGVGVPL